MQILIINTVLSLDLRSNFRQKAGLFKAAIFKLYVNRLEAYYTYRKPGLMAPTHNTLKRLSCDKTR